VGDVAVGEIMYSISQAIVQMGKDWMQTVLKDRIYHAARYVETAFRCFMGNCVLCYGVLFCVLTQEMVAAVYRVDIVCRISDCKFHYVNSP
jgi:hypothetical protein